MMIHLGGVANDNCDIHNSVGMNMKHLFVKNKGAKTVWVQGGSSGLDKH